MDLIDKLRLKGCLNTPPLWTGELSGIDQLILTNEVAERSDDTHGPRGRTGVARPSIPSEQLAQRLGKRVEQFIFQRLKQGQDIDWIGDNIQISRPDKTTVGEIDALFYQDSQLVHLEVAYKFYLFDTVTSYSSPLAYWIGPNRNDRLVEKLDKLQQKQFPLLFDPLTLGHMQSLGLNVAAAKQKICFKAQLFLPFAAMDLDITPLNKDCIYGFHLPFEMLERLSDCSFYIPAKLDWLIQPHLSVEWVGFSELKPMIESYIQVRRSPMLWVRTDKGVLRKGFVTFWGGVQFTLISVLTVLFLSY